MATRTTCSPPWAAIVERMPGGWPSLTPLALVTGVLGLVAAVIWPPAMLVLVGGATAAVSLAAPPVGLGLLAVSIPAQDLAEQPLGPIELRWTSAILLGLIGAWALRLVATRRWPRWTWTTVPFAAYVPIAAASGIVAGDARAWAGELYRWSAALVVFVIAADLLPSGRDGAVAVRPILVGIAAGVAAASLLGCYQTVAEAGPRSFRVGGWTRAYATFGQPNPFAGYLELTVPLLVAAGAGSLVSRKIGRGFGGPLALACGGAAVLGSAALVLTQSRSGWLGGLVGIGAVVLVLGGLRWAVPALAMVVIVALIVTPVGDRLATGAWDGWRTLRSEEHSAGRTFATEERLAHWRAALRMARAQPLLGVGAGNFSARFREFTSGERFRVSRGHAHNAYLQVAAQTGLLGLAAYLALLATAGFRLVRALRRAVNPEERALVVGAIGVTLALAVHGAFDYLHVLSLGLQLSIVWALAEVAGRSEGPVGDGAVPA